MNGKFRENQGSKKCTNKVELLICHQKYACRHMLWTMTYERLTIGKLNHIHYKVYLVWRRIEQVMKYWQFYMFDI